ncbi:helix-turn-helix domain-containing protein [Chryseobacterium gossypii]|uniref:helix-turn-helix domain-containing protein n=1 Tax=Chryseobacterium gossypii TaxID=3231602 RepID=UPI003526B0FA
MNKETEKGRPDYIRIYTDIINAKFPHKKEECKVLLNKKTLSTLDIIELNKKIFGESDDEQTTIYNRKHRSYDKKTILHILDYQKKHRYNNQQVAKQFKISRNTVRRWKKIFQV